MTTNAIPSITDVTAALQHAGILGNIVPADVQLKGVLEISYPSGVTVTVGQTPHREQVQGQPTVRFHPASAVDADSSYTLIMTDPDLMKTDDPIDKQVRHWVQPGLRKAGADSSELRATRDAHTAFLGSAPMPLTGAHRYVFILAREPLDSTTALPGIGERRGQADFRERLGFVAADFVREFHMEIVGVAFMKVSPTAKAGVEDVKLMAESAKHVVTRA